MKEKTPFDEIGRTLSPAGKETKSEKGVSQTQIAKKEATWPRLKSPLSFVYTRVKECAINEPKYDLKCQIHNK